MIFIWTAAQPGIIEATFGKSLLAMKPNVPPHKFIAWVKGEAPPAMQPGDVLVVAGTKPLDNLKELKLAPKGRTVNSLREKVLTINGGHAVVTFDPQVINSEPDKKSLIDWDLRLAQRLHDTGSTMPQVGKYRYVPNFTSAIERIEQLHEETGKPVDVALDLETMGFLPWYEDRDIVTVQVTVDVGTADVLYLGPQDCPVKPTLPKKGDILDQIRFLLTSPKVKLRGANLKFDLLWILIKWGVRCTNFKFDTMLVGSLLNENRSNSLNMHAKVYTTMGGYDDPFNDRYDKGHMELIPADEDLLTYAGGDTDACQRVANVMKDELLADPGLANFYITVLHPAARAFEQVERRGVYVDQQKFAILRDDLTKVIDEGYQEAIAILPHTMRVKYRERIEEQLSEGKSPMLPSILKDYFFGPKGLNLKPKMLTGKTQEPSMAKTHLKMFADHPDAAAMVEALTKADVAAKTRSTFVDGFVKEIRPDGYIHPTYFLAHAEYEGFDGDDSGTDTGRLSAKGPAFQIIPKKTLWAKRIRDCYPAPKGKVIMQLDYSQGELRVVACVANEKNMIEAYANGMDLHSLTGSQLAGVEYKEFLSWKNNDDAKLAKLFDDIRSRAKAGNFGLLYGMGAAGFQAYAWANYGLRLSLEDAEHIRDLFFKAYPGLTNYHERQKKFVNLHEMVRSPLGRVAHLPTVKAWDREIKSKAERKAINSPIQSTLSDMMIWSIAMIEDAYPNDEIAVVGMIHDAMVAYVDEDKVALRAAQAQEIMSNLPFHELGWHPQLTFPADAEAGNTLASLKEIKQAA